MKGKKILALASIFAGVALVGTTLALWAVTDNADPFNLKISPGSIEDDLETKRVTLSYGQKVYTNVGELVNGTKRLAATVDLQAQWDVDENYSSFSGQFSVELSQTSSETVKLIDYLNIYVVSTAPTVDGNGVVTAHATSGEGFEGSLLYNVESHKATFSVTLGTPNEQGLATKRVYVIVEYRETTVDKIDALSDDEVSLKLDWNKAGEGVVGAYTIYYSGSDVPYVFAWSQDNSKRNHSYPGEPMTLVRPGLYSYELLDDYYGFLITRQDESKITPDDVIIAGDGNWKETYYDNDYPCFNGTSWVSVPEEVNYYVIGSFNMNGQDWVLADSNYKMTPGSADSYVFSNLNLAAGAQIKVYTDSDSGHWYGDADFTDWAAMAALATVGENGNVVVTNAGHYDVTFYNNAQSQSSGNYIGLAVHGS